MMQAEEEEEAKAQDLELGEERSSNEDEEQCDFSFMDALERKSTMSPVKRPAHLKWKDLCYSVEEPALLSSTGSKTTKVLNEVNGEVGPGHILAIMGSPGAGKTTLLNLLAGRQEKDRKATMSGKILVNGKKRDFKEFRRISAFVPRDTTMFGELTVEEEIVFSANLRLPNNYRDTYRRSKANNIINELGLRAVKTDRMDSSSEVSGGDLRRVSIGVELVTSPSMIFLDGPLDGLDPLSAVKVIEALRNLAQQGRTIVLTVEAPRSNVYELFDQLMLMSMGSVVYAGLAKDATSYFADIGYPCPTSYNPADFLTDLVSEDKRDELALNGDETDWIVELADSFVEHQIALDTQEATPEQEVEAVGQESPTSSNESPGRFSSRWVRELYYLCQRSARVMGRRTWFNARQILAQVVLALITGLIWLGVGYKYARAPTPELRDALVGALAFITMVQSFETSLATSLEYPTEATVVERERSRGTYRLSSYYLAKALIEIPRGLLFSTVFVTFNYWIIGFRYMAGSFFQSIAITFLVGLCAQGLTLSTAALFKDRTTTMLVVPIFLIISMLFSGFLIDVDMIPVWIRWIQYLSFIRHALTAFLFSQFMADDPVGAEVLNGYGNPSAGAIAYIALSSIAVGLRLLGYIFLRITTPRFDRTL